MTFLPLILGGMVAIGLGLLLDRKEPRQVMMQAGKRYRVTLEIEDPEMAQLVIDTLEDVGADQFDGNERKLSFTMRSGADLPVIVPSQMPGLPDGTNIVGVREI